MVRKNWQWALKWLWARTRLQQAMLLVDIGFKKQQRFGRLVIHGGVEEFSAVRVVILILVIEMR